MGTWLLFFDIDGVLWDHLDVSSTEPPFKRISEDTIVDSEGERLTLKKGAVSFIKWARSVGAIVSSCSWNDPHHAIAALKAFGLEKLFDFQGIRSDPYKHLIILSVLDRLESVGVPVQRDRIFYMDDRNIHLKDIKESIPEITFLHMWKDVRSFDSAKMIIQNKLNGT